MDSIYATHVDGSHELQAVLADLTADKIPTASRFRNKVMCSDFFIHHALEVYGSVGSRFV